MTEPNTTSHEPDAEGKTTNSIPTSFPQPQNHVESSAEREQVLVEFFGYLNAVDAAKAAITKLPPHLRIEAAEAILNHFRVEADA